MSFLNNRENPVQIEKNTEELLQMRSWSTALSAGCMCLDVGGYIINVGLGMNDLLFLIWIIISTCIMIVGLGLQCRWLVETIILKKINYGFWKLAQISNCSKNMLKKRLESGPPNFKRYSEII